MRVVERALHLPIGPIRESVVVTCFEPSLGGDADEGSKKLPTKLSERDSLSAQDLKGTV